MAASPELLVDETPRKTAASGSASSAALLPWLRTQSINVTRHSAALRPFRREEFGNGPAAPSESHIQVVNHLISTLRRGLLKMSRSLTAATITASGELSPSHLQRVVVHKDNAQRWVQGIEKIWDFYLELFGQRQSKYGDGC
jgi:hypothetical protein